MKVVDLWVGVVVIEDGDEGVRGRRREKWVGLFTDSSYK
jgi:hypothetical protein